jgi:hypothetical protein
VNGWLSVDRLQLVIAADDEAPIVSARACDMVGA